MTFANGLAARHKSDLPSIMDKGADRKARTRIHAKRGSTASPSDPILAAAAQIGEDLRGKDGVVGYLRRLAVKKPMAFAGLMRTVLISEIKRPPAAVKGPPPRITKEMSVKEAAEIYERTVKGDW